MKHTQNTHNLLPAPQLLTDSLLPTLEGLLLLLENLDGGLIHDINDVRNALDRRR